MFLTSFAPSTVSRLATGSAYPEKRNNSTRETTKFRRGRRGTQTNVVSGDGALNSKRVFGICPSYTTSGPQCRVCGSVKQPNLAPLSRKRARSLYERGKGRHLRTTWACMRTALERKWTGMFWVRFDKQQLSYKANGVHCGLFNLCVQPDTRGNECTCRALRLRKIQFQYRHKKSLI